MKHNYYYTIQQEEDGYSAYIPAFKATVVDEDLKSIEEAIENTIEMCIDLYKKEGRKIPPEDGKLKTSGKIALRIPKSLHRKIIFQAKNEGVSMNQYIVSKLSS